MSQAHNPTGEEDATRALTDPVAFGLTLSTQTSAADIVPAAKLPPRQHKCSDDPPTPPRPKRNLVLAPVLVSMAWVASIVSSLGAPLIPTIAHRFHESLSTAQWSLTVALLSGAIGSPIMGRLGDGRYRKQTAVRGLVIVASGCTLAGAAVNMPMLLIGRTMQGIGVGLVPLAMATARDEMPTAKVAPTVSILSVAAAAGVGAGYPISGLIAEMWGLRGAFWFGAIVSGVVLLAVAVVIPSTASRHGSAHLDLLGATLLTLALVMVLVGIAQGSEWGWTSLETATFLAVGTAALLAWVAQQMYTAIPLVDIRLLHHPGVLAANTCAMVLGGAMYMSLSAVVEFVQTPRTAGFGFAASVVVAGTVLVPMSFFMVIGSRLLPSLQSHLPAKKVLAAGSMAVALSGGVFALFHGDLFETFVMMGLMGAGLGITFGAIPGLIVSAVPPRETGSALGFYQVVRLVGFSIGSALAASFLKGTSTSGGLPTLGEYTAVFWVSAGICGVAAGVSWVSPSVLLVAKGTSGDISTSETTDDD